MLYINIYLADTTEGNEGKTTGDPLNLAPIAISSTDVNGINFNSEELSSIRLGANTEYCLVVFETPDTPDDYIFRLFSRDNANGKAYKNDNGTITFLNKDFYHKVFYSGNLTTVSQDILVDFATNGYGKGYELGMEVG